MKAPVALVTGANGGIGSAVCASLRSRGVMVRTLDISEPADVLVDLAVDRIPSDVTGDVDVCVSVAGIVDTFARAHTISEAKWSREIDVNLTGAFRVIQACLPGMREREFGRIVVVSSMAAKMGSPGKVAYAAAKAGLLGMVRTIAIENSDRGITANTILPGMIATPKVDMLPANDKSRILAEIPTGRFGRPDEVANLVSYLASPDAAYITAQEIGIDGGLELRDLFVGPLR
jgi:NAD(P)-dependent dehydrogenase (short-subunit alcohol dehydrogenase family)